MEIQEVSQLGDVIYTRQNNNNNNSEFVSFAAQNFVSTSVIDGPAETVIDPSLKLRMQSCDVAALLKYKNDEGLCRKPASAFPSNKMSQISTNFGGSSQIQSLNKRTFVEEDFEEQEIVCQEMHLPEIAK